MTEDLAPRIEEQITAWRTYVSRRDAIDVRDVDELEDHLRGHLDRLEASGLSPDEAFLIAVKRIGKLDDLSREFAREHSDRLWKQLMFAEPAAEPRGRSVWLALGLAVGAGLAIKVPALFGIGFDDSGDFYARFGALLVLPFLAAFFLVRRSASVRTIALVAAPFVLGAVVMAVYPFAPDGATLLLAALHLVVVLWLVIGIAYVGGAVGSSRGRMDFVRFTGEWFVYFVLIALGGGVLIALTMGVFSTIDLDVSWVVEEWLLPCGIAGAAVIAGWLVEAKQSVVENIAPVLTRLFTPLFTLLLLAFIVAGSLQGNLIESGGDVPEVFGQRDLLILFDIVLLVVLGLLLYALSARDGLAPPSWFDRLQLVMVLAALVVDIMVLVAMIGRIAEYGASPNKLASLGLNVILFANLAGAAWLQLRFVMRKTPFERLERWQTGYIPVYLAWAAIVVVVFPPAFQYV
ncbi:permease prefix domain 1-containing protein [Microbacterium sp. CPCC 204701]|uniref:permease prefix domain 1-containing protein n=1 Tax=Microbacterium sp. CPCC 204701 TaxID=2493084 RepID=UPI000FD7B677|nr:permease prefix domain 1-containing protein [Microbacterium sp. CPCC 204701]